MRHGRRHFTRHPRSVVLPANNLDLPRRKGLLLWLSGLAVLLYVTQLAATPDHPLRQPAHGPAGPSTIVPNG